MLSLFKAIDLFHFQLSFNFKKDPSFHSIFGIIFSILIYLLIITFFSYFSYDFFYNTNPLIVFKENEFNGNFTIPFNKLFKKLKYNFKYNDSLGNFPDSYKNLKNISNPIMFLEFSIFSEKKNNCESLIFKENVEINYDEENKLYNINANEVFNNEKQILYFTGDNSKKKFVDINYTIYQYTNLKDINLTFYDFSELSINLLFDTDNLHSFLEGNLDISEFDLSYEINDNIMNVDEPDFFFEYSMEENIRISSFKQKNFPHESFYYNYGLVKLVNDEGFIFSSKEEDLNLKKYFGAFSMNIADSNIVNILNLKFDNIMKIYERKYKKIQDVFAELGGLINTLIIVVKIVSNLLNKNKFDYEMINNIFGVNTIQKKIINHEMALKDTKIKKDKSIKIQDNKDKLLKSINSFDDSNVANRSHKNNLITREFFGLETVNNKLISNLTNDRVNDVKDFNLKISQKYIKQINSSNKELNKILQLHPENGKSTYSLVKSKKGFVYNRKIFEKKVNTLFENYKKDNKFISFSFSEFVKLYLCCKNTKNVNFVNKNKIFMRLADKISDYLDIINYCTIFENFEKLKIILLNENQNFTFDFIKNNTIEEVSKDNFKLKLKNSFKYFKKNDLNEIDRRLMDNFCYNFKNFLN